jgi:hypothetical protein
VTLTTALVAVAIVLRLLGGLGYLVATIRGRVRPSIVSWFFWGIVPMITLTVQIQQHVGVEALITLVLGLGPLSVFITAIIKHTGRMRFTPADLVCGAFAMLGLALWFITSNPLIAIVCGILGDLFSAVPTIIKCYTNPESEHALPYFLSSLSMVAALFAIREWDFVHYAFSTYMLSINAAIAALIVIRTVALRPAIKLVIQRKTRKSRATIARRRATVTKRAKPQPSLRDTA